MNKIKERANKLVTIPLEVYNSQTIELIISVNAVFKFRMVGKKSANFVK